MPLLVVLLANHPPPPLSGVAPSVVVSPQLSHRARGHQTAVIYLFFRIEFSLIAVRETVPRAGPGVGPDL